MVLQGGADSKWHQHLARAEDDRGGGVSQPECSAEARSESQGGDSHETVRPCQIELKKESMKGPSERNEKYNLRPNLTPSQEL
ncbi:hypothetical protein NDU88_003545 [Pleurodeles waltl]|uniref:Prolactin receptor n=1 Tax=Pleurodeles waltl TaxID=8319 RepID=A0AAV7V0C4_PLEWA|nr:hypothetical protein NDU88_003545 [Pleurodeles waltl]